MKKIELCMLDTVGGEEAAKIMNLCIDRMPPKFFWSARLFAPTAPAGDSIRESKLVTAFHFNQAFFPPAPGNERYLYNVFRLREMWRPAYEIEAEFFMTVQRDGFILNPEKWEDEFANYDFIGAPWDATSDGGNSGFSIISIRFANWISTHTKPIPAGMEGDWWTCKYLNEEAKAAGFRFAPPAVCARFSLENDVPEFQRTLKDTFGFHGAHRLPEIK